jgi:hypothetical protein
VGRACSNARTAALSGGHRQNGAVQFPTPDDPRRAPIWDNYVVAQAAQAALRLIPPYVHAMGVEVQGRRIGLVVHAPPDAPRMDEDIDDIADQSRDLLGSGVDIYTRIDARPACHLRPGDGVRWFYAARP